MGHFLVTGCAGFVGSHLTEKLVCGGHDVIGIDCFSDYYSRGLKEANLSNVDGLAPGVFTLIEGDLSRLSLEQLVANSDGVFHLAAQAGVRGSWGSSYGSYLKDNVLATQRIFEACAEAGRRVVFASSSSVYGNSLKYPMAEAAECKPISPYGVSKLTCEHLASAYASERGLDFVGLRYFTIYGPRQRPDMAFTRIARTLLSGDTFGVLGSGTQSRDFTYVSDAVDATVAAMNCGSSNKFYNVGGGEELSLLQAMQLFEVCAELSLSVRFSPEVPGDVQRTAADTTMLRQVSGWAPRVDARTGVAAQFAWVKASMDKFVDRLGSSGGCLGNPDRPSS